MKLEPNDRRYLNVGLAGGLLLLYFLGVSILGVSLVVPYAFLWLMWTLTKIASGLEKQKEQIERLAAR